MALTHRGLYVEYRIQQADAVRVRQIIMFDSVVFSRSINTENPRRHWKPYKIANPAEVKVDERFPIVKTWLQEVDRQFLDAGYSLSAEPFLVEATDDEYQSQILAGETPRNVILRTDRVREKAGRPDPLERV